MRKLSFQNKLFAVFEAESCIPLQIFLFAVFSRDRKRTEPSRIITVRFGSNRTEPNSNRIFGNALDPNRTRTGFRKTKPNRTELEPVKPGSIRSLMHKRNVF